MKYGPVFHQFIFVFLCKQHTTFFLYFQTSGFRHHMLGCEPVYGTCSQSSDGEGTCDEEEGGGNQLLPACFQFISISMVEAVGWFHYFDGFPGDSEMVGMNVMQAFSFSSKVSSVSGVGGEY
jgi:hypothetical protein